MTTADDLDAVWAAARPVIEDAFHSDTYTVKRPTPATDGRGGATITFSDVESGKCSLVVSNTQGREYVSGSTVDAVGPYWADMPWSTTIRETDEIVINDRRFDVAAVKREGDWGVSVRVDLEARST